MSRCVWRREAPGSTSGKWPKSSIGCGHRRRPRRSVMGPGAEVRRRSRRGLLAALLRPSPTGSGWPRKQKLPRIRIRRSERPPSSVAAQFAVESAGNSTPGASPVGRESKEHRIAPGQVPAPEGCFADPPPGYRPRQTRKRIFEGTEFGDVQHRQIAPKSD